MEKINNVSTATTSPQTMNLFLDIGEKLDLFKTITMNLPSGNTENRYTKKKAVRVLSLLTEYFSQPLHQEEKNEFLKSIDTLPKEQVYKDMVDIVLHYLLTDKNDTFIKGEIESYQKKSKNKQTLILSTEDFPAIADAYLPSWYKDHNHTEGKIPPLHELFQKKLAEQENNLAQADEITQKTKKHFEEQTEEENISYDVQQQIVDTLKEEI